MADTVSRTRAAATTTPPASSAATPPAAPPADARTTRGTAPPASSSPTPERRWQSLARRAWQRVLAWPSWIQVLVAYLASRVLCTVVIELAARWFQNPAGVGVLNPHYGDMVGIWDGEWYRRIAEQGYPHALPHGPIGNVDYNSWAFFPVFPLVVRAVMATGMSFDVAASVVNLIAGAGAALLIWRLFGARSSAPDDGTDRLAVGAVALWCVLPAAPVLQIAYTEALAALLLAATLLLLHRRQYLWASPVVLLLGLTRAIAAPLVVVVLWHGLQRWRHRREDAWPASRRWSFVALLVATGASAVLWPAIVALETGVPGAFFDTQAAWGQKPADGPFVPWVTWAWEGLGVLGVVLLLAVVAGGARLLAGRHTAWLVSDLRVFGVAYPVYLLAVVRPITSMWRFLLLDLPLAAALASAVVAGRTADREAGARRPGAWRWRLVAAAVLGLAAMGWWTAVYLTRIPWSDSPP